MFIVLKKTYIRVRHSLYGDSNKSAVHQYMHHNVLFALDWFMINLLNESDRWRCHGFLWLDYNVVI